MDTAVVMAKLMELSCCSGSEMVVEVNALPELRTIALAALVPISPLGCKEALGVPLDGFLGGNSLEHGCRLQCSMSCSGSLGLGLSGLKNFGSQSDGRACDLFL